jgi:hypothetical protein
MVTGMPLLTPEQYSDKTVAWAEGTKEANLESDQGISWEDTWRHGGSIGSSEQETREFFEKTTRFQVRYQGLQCYIGAGHFQFIGRKSIFQEIIPLYAERPMGGEVRNLDIAINSHGYLRLNTPEWHVEHMGNTMVERFINQIMDHPGGTEKEIEKQTKEHWVTRIPIIRRLLKSIYRRIFKVLYR